MLICRDFGSKRGDSRNDDCPCCRGGKRTSPQDNIITFYVPFFTDGATRLPDNMEEYWEWICSSGISGEGKYSWTLQTYLRLTACGYSCKLAVEFPRDGIVIAHRDFLPVYLWPRSDVFLVCIKPDRKEHPWAQYYLVQSERDGIFSRLSSRRVSKIGFWPQPSLLPREEGRGDQVYNLAFFGRLGNLTAELKSDEWTRELRKLGLAWATPPMEKWHDYREVDVTVSVRGFELNAAASDPVYDPNAKPPSKLINSWLAGVPAIVGREPAFLPLRQADTDFLEVRSLSELIDAVKRLRDDKALYRAMRERARLRAVEFSTDKNCRQWIEVLDGPVFDAYSRWKRSGRVRRQFDNFARLACYFSRGDNLRDIAKALVK